MMAGFDMDDDQVPPFLVPDGVVCWWLSVLARLEWCLKGLPISLSFVCFEGRPRGSAPHRLCLYSFALFFSPLSSTNNTALTVVVLFYCILSIYPLIHKAATRLEANSGVSCAWSTASIGTARSRQKQQRPGKPPPLLHMQPPAATTARTSSSTSPMTTGTSRARC